jgi:hypothetical protein
MSKENSKKLIRQLFLGKVSEVIGFDKTLQLLKEADDVFSKSEHPEHLEKEFNNEFITSFLGLNRPYSLDSVLDKLIKTSDILMHEKNYDGHGWEILREARQEAVYYKKQIEDYLHYINN